MASTSAQMASDSSSSTSRCTYDVFLSFRGEDTRYNFTDHLYTALVQRGVNTFRDDKLRRGEEIAPELLKAIEESRSSIVVFSKTYVDSRWCLDELAKIMECKREYRQIVLPIFYHVDPSDVRKQTGSFGEAFTNYEENWKNKAQRWREALTEAGNISGWHINEEYESEHIKKITTNIVHRLGCKLLFVEDNLVGMGFHLKKMSLGLSTLSNDVRMVGICGIGGIGKTTIAKYVYNQISWRFECSSFLEKVREACKNKGLLRLQNQLLNDIMVEGNKNISTISQGANMIKNSLHFRKALIVFDNVDDMDQLEFLVGNHNWFGNGSRIIITTRDKHLLTMLKVDYLYEVKGLNSQEALELFSQHAFLPNLPREDYKNLLDRVMHYCQGLPLALKVLGSLLCGKTTREWESELHKLEKEPEVKIQNVLKISFDGLDRTQKKTFLDIACLFEGEDRDFASKVLDSCGLYGERGIRVLWERCLITISNNKICMHDLIQQMGQEIVREQHPEAPSKWSRLWNPDDIYRAFTSKKGMKNVETICLDLSRSNEIWFTSKIFAQMKKVFAKMNKLRLLKIYYSHRCEYKMLLPKDFEFPSNLRYLHWEGLESLPLNFHGENLIAINLKSSNIKEFWAGNKCLAKLKFIDLSNSKQLIKMPKFSSMPNLERLNLEECTHLRQLHSSISAFPEMKFLRELNLSGSGIKEVPSSIGCFKSLEILDLSKCSKFEKFPDIIFVNMEHLRRLELSESGIKELPNNIGYLDSLKFLNLSGCLNFEKFPEIQGKMKHLEWLYLKKTAIKELPNSIGYLESLKALDLSGCSNFEKFPEIQGNMKHLERLSLADTAIKELPISFESLEALESLSLSRCSNFKKFPEIQKNMESLYFLYLNGTAIKELSCSMGHLPKLASLDLGNCKNLKSIQSNISELKSLHRYSLNGCSNLEAFSEITEDMEHLQLLHLRGMVIGELPSSIERLRGLTRLELSNCENLVSLPNTIGNLTCLHTLLVHNCSKLHKLPDNLRSLQRCLRILDLGGCNLMEGAIPSDLWCLFSLVSLNVSENNIRRIPTGIIHLAQLYTLRMNHCPMLEEIPKLPSSLRSIEAHGCPHLEALSSDPTHLLWSSLLNCFKSENQDFRCRRNPDRRLRSGIHIVIPGRSGIPEWISCESKGCEATINLPKNWYEDDSFLGFALSFQHLPLDNDNEYEIRHGLMDLEGSRHGYLQDGTLPQCLLSISHGEQSKHVANVTFDMNCKSYSVGGVAYDLHSYDTSSTSSTDPALLMAYFLQNTISSEYRSSGWNRLKARFGGTFRCGNKVAFKVESYGIHLIYDYAPDHHQQNENQEIHEGGPSGSGCSNTDGSESENSDYYSADEGDPTTDR